MGGLLCPPHRPSRPPGSPPGDGDSRHHGSRGHPRCTPARGRRGRRHPWPTLRRVTAASRSSGAPSSAGRRSSAPLAGGNRQRPGRAVPRGVAGRTAPDRGNRRTPNGLRSPRPRRRRRGSAPPRRLGTRGAAEGRPTSRGIPCARRPLRVRRRGTRAPRRSYGRSIGTRALPVPNTGKGIRPLGSERR